MRKVFVFGDIILDRYCIGSVKRLSPESPVPIVNLQSTNKVLGGAANVAANISALGRKVDLCGIIGKDLAGNDVSELLKKYGVGNKLHELSTAKTIVKTRVMLKALVRNLYAGRLSTLLMRTALRLLWTPRG